MKKIALLFVAICALLLVACENPAKSRVYTEEGSRLLLSYSKFEEAEEILTKAIMYDKGNYKISALFFVIFL